MKLTALVPPGTHSVRAVLRDSSGRIGTADVDPALVPKITDNILPPAGKHNR